MTAYVDDVRNIKFIHFLGKKLDFIGDAAKGRGATRDSYNYGCVGKPLDGGLVEQRELALLGGEIGDVKQLATIHSVVHPILQRYKKTAPLSPSQNLRDAGKRRTTDFGRLILQPNPSSCPMLDMHTCRRTFIHRKSSDSR